MISRRGLLGGLGWTAAAGGLLYLVRDRIPWPPPKVAFAGGRQATAWHEIPRGSNLIALPGSAAGADLNVVVDSGAQFTAIDAGLAQRLNLPETLALPLLAYGVSGGPTLTHTVRLDLELPGLTVRGVRAAVLDLAGVSRATGRDFAMLLGRDVLRALTVEADFPSDRARFHAPGAYAPPADAVRAPLKLMGGAPMIEVRVEQAPPIQVLVDTGATGALALSQAAATDAGLTGAGRRVTEARSVSLGGVSLDQVVEAEEVRLAGLTFRDIPVQIYAPSLRGAIPPGLLGAGILGRFRMALDLAGGQLFLIRPTPQVVARRRRNRPAP